jgi:sialate O-acetylesterase
MKISKLLTLLLVCAAVPLQAQIRLPKLISDHMVLQRDQPLKIWGRASPKERISLQFDQKTYKTTATAAGKWEIKLPAHPAGTGFSMVLKGKNEVRIANIAFGDVWLCSGQSNMVINMERVKEHFPADIAAANFPDIRNFFVPTLTSLSGPADDFPKGEWKVANADNILSFGAVAYFFARDIYEKHHVPIGIINSSVGGTPIEAWISEKGFADFEDIQKTIARNEDTSYVNAFATRAGTRLPDRTAVADAGRTGHWESADYHPKGWRNFNIPGYWEDQGLKALDGVVWFRKTIHVPQNWIGKPVKLYMGRIVDADEMYVNGRKIGHITYQYPPRRYEIPGDLLKPGANVFVSRVTNSSGKGGFVPDKPYFMTTGADTIDLKGTWQYKVGAVFPPEDKSNGNAQLVHQNQPAALYNAMIAPVLPLKVKGFVWYQGESNTDNPLPYHALLPALIKDWRAHWNNDNLPFLVAQLPNFQDIDFTPAESNYALLREAQNKALTLPHTAVAVTIDLGEWNDIHPLNKKDIGKRLALAARNVAYGEKDVVYSGPVLQSQSTEDGKLVLTFAHVGDGIVSADGEALRWFAVAGDDGKFFWAQAEILAKDRIALRSDQVNSPRYVRYAWQDNPVGVNFYNSAGLPASPFRTDGQDSNAFKTF